jgi:hypothetical protein
MADLIILQQVKDNTVSLEEASQLLRAFYLAERKTLSYKISEKGAISFYGIRKMPITLYQEELDQVHTTARNEAFKQFLMANRAQLSFKDPAKAELPEGEVEASEQPDSVVALLDSFKNGQISMAVVQQHLKELEQKAVTYKVSTKGAISFYGIRRMPITLYKEELDLIMETINTDAFKEFLREHASELSRKPVKEPTVTKPVKQTVPKTTNKPGPKVKPAIKLNMVK